MQSKATTVAQYLAELPPDRRADIQTVRKLIHANLGSGFEEGMTYGMIGYYVPHSLFPAGYHCDPKQPLPFAGLASQKHYMALYVMGLYSITPEGKPRNEHGEWFHREWNKSGKKLDAGKACIRFKKLDELPLDVIAGLFRRFTAKGYTEQYQRARDSYQPKTRAEIQQMMAKRAAAKTKAKAAKKVGKRAAT